MKPDLTTRYLGLTLAHPIVAGAGPLTGEVATLRELEAEGAAAVVLPSLFQEQIEHDEMEAQRVAEFGAESFPEALSYFPALDRYNTGPERYLTHVAASKAALGIPVIASLNGPAGGDWVSYAKKIEEAGADALELNTYFLPADPQKSAGEVERQYLDLVRQVRSQIQIPLAVKIGPFFSSPAHFVAALTKAGADGVVLFNRFVQPDIDLEGLSVEPRLELSTSRELRLPLRWIAILRGATTASLAATTGAHTAEDVLKLLLVGADAAMLVSALLENGPEHLRKVIDGLSSWLEEKGYESVEQLKGSLSLANTADPEAFERANYMKTLASYTTKGTWA